MFILKSEFSNSMGTKEGHSDMGCEYHCNCNCYIFSSKLYFRIFIKLQICV